MLHTFADGSRLLQISAKELVAIDVWQGQRTLDHNHAKKIKDAIGNNINRLDSTVFRIIQYREMNNASNHYTLQKYLIDGQHRAHVIRTHFQENLCEPDFKVLVIEKNVDSESDAIDFFNMLNNVKPQQWSHDPNLLANKYITASSKQFNTDKKNELIRIGKVTKRPFLSGDVLRVALVKEANKLKHDDETIQLFVSRVTQWNAKAVSEIRLKLLNEKETKNFSLIEAVDKRNFALAYDAKLSWIQECLPH